VSLVVVVGVGLLLLIRIRRVVVLLSSEEGGKEEGKSARPFRSCFWNEREERGSQEGQHLVRGHRRVHLSLVVGTSYQKRRRTGMDGWMEGRRRRCEVDVGVLKGTETGAASRPRRSLFPW